MGVQLNMDYSTIEPSQGGRSYLPISDNKGWLAVITDSGQKENSKNNGVIMVLSITGQEGPAMGRTTEHIINLKNPSQKAMEIGAGECSAIAHALGHIRVGNSSEWHGKPLRVVVESDASEQYPNATKIVRFLTANGEMPRRAGQQVMQGGQQQGNFGGQQQQFQPQEQTQQQPQFQTQAQPQGQGQFQPQQTQQQFQPQNQGQFQPQGQMQGQGQFQPQGQVQQSQPAFDPNTGQPLNQGQPQFQQGQQQGQPGWTQQ